MRTYIYSPSYPSVRLIVYLKKLGKDVVIITSNESIINLSELMNWEYIKFDLTIKQSLRYLLKNIHLYIKAKKLLNEANNKVIKKIKNGSDFYFTIKGLDLFGLNLIDALIESGKCKAYFWSETETKEEYREYLNEGLSNKFIRNIRLKITSSIYNRICNIKFKWMKGPDGVYLFIADNNWQYSKYEEKVFENIFKENIYENNQIKIKEGEKHPVFILGYTLKEDARLYGQEFVQLFEFIMRFENIYLKQHPGSKEAYSNITNQNHWLQANIPIEFLNSGISFVITTTSTSISGLKNIPCISLLEMLTNPSEDFQKEKRRESMELISNKIYFPKTYTELSELITYLQDQSGRNHKG